MFNSSIILADNFSSKLQQCVSQPILSQNKENSYAKPYVCSYKNRRRTRKDKKITTYKKDGEDMVMCQKLLTGNPCVSSYVRDLVKVKCLH